MKRVFALLVLVASCVVVSPAFAEIKVEGDVYVGMFDKYIWRGYNLSENTPVIQGGVDLTAHNLTLSYWTTGQVKDDAGNQGGDANETDITLDYAFDLGELLSLNVGNIYYTIDGENDTNELYLSATLNTLLEPTVKGYYDWDEAQNDRFYTFDISHGFELGKATLNATALAGYNAYEHEPWNVELGLTADVKVAEQITVSPSFLYSSPLSNDAQRDIDTEMVGGLTITHAF